MKAINRILRLREVAKCLFVFCIFSFCVNGINAQSVVIDNLLYEVVNLTEASVKANSKDITSANILEKVEIEGVEYAVTSIGTEGFRGCTTLSSIVIPESIKSIGDNAFFLCRDLVSISLPNGLESIGDDLLFLQL